MACISLASLYLLLGKKKRPVTLNPDVKIPLKLIEKQVILLKSEKMNKYLLFIVL